MGTPECRGPESNWGHRNFQSRALPTELPRQTEKERAMGFEPTTFSLARRRSTTELHPLVGSGHEIEIEENPPSLSPAPISIRSVDPVGFEPTISCLQSRRLPTWPRARTTRCPSRRGADERTRTSTPLRAADPKSAASANSATSATWIRPDSLLDWPYPRFCISRHLSHRAHNPVAAPSL